MDEESRRSVGRPVGSTVGLLRLSKNTHFHSNENSIAVYDGDWGPKNNTILFGVSFVLQRIITK